MANSAKFKPQNNPRFVQPIIHENLNSFSIPVSFKEKLEEEGYETEKVVLVDEIDSRKRDFDGEWEVKVEGGCHFTQGWKEFCEDHELGLGDILVFTHLGNLVFHVSFFELATSCGRPLRKGTSNHGFTHTREPGEVEAATPASSYCDVSITPYAHERGDINLPKFFVRSNHLYRKHCQIELIDEKGKSWGAKLSYRDSSSQSYIGRGMKDFLVEKNLKPNEIIRFEFLKGGERPTMKCYRTSNCSSSSTHGRKPVDDEAATTGRPSVKSKFPSFDFTVSSSLLKRPTKAIIHIPMSFARSNGFFKKRCPMELIDGKGKPWPVNLHFKKSNNQSYIYIAQGWEGFKVRNSLKPGNLIRFELLKNADKPIMKCYRLTSQKRQDHSG